MQSPDYINEDLTPSDEPEVEEFSFKSLLHEAMTHKADGERLKAGRKALKDGTPMASADMAELLADVKRIETRREWLPRAAVAMFQVQHCVSCENYSPFFTGLFQRQANRTMRNADRWVTATESENGGLSKEVKTTEIDVPFCAFCIGEHGFPAEQLGVEFDADAIPAADDMDDEQTKAEALAAEFEAAQDDLIEDLQINPAQMCFTFEKATA